MALDPIPALPDQERRTRYTISPASADPVQVGFDIYGSGTDPTAWVEVYVDGVLFEDWTLSSPSGPLNVIARPITDAVITPGEAWSGTIDIVAAERPFRTVQLQDGRPVDPRTFNFAITQLTARQREVHDRFERTVKMPFGEDGYVFPFSANRNNTVFGFDANGDPALLTAAQDITQAVRFDIAQSLTDGQKRQARENIGAPEWADLQCAFYPSKATVEATNVPADYNVLYVTDLDAHFVRRGASEPTHAGKIKDNADEWWEIEEPIYTVRMFGAKADCTDTGVGTDDREAFQNCIDAAIANRKKVIIPGGRYRIGSPGLKVDLASIIGSVEARLCIEGDGRGSTLLYFDTGDYAGLHWTGGTSGAGNHALSRLSGFYCRKSDNLGAGLKIEDAAFMTYADIYCSGWECGFDLHDCLSSSMNGVISRFNKYGMRLIRDSGSQPNAITLTACVLGNNIENGLVGTNVGNLTMVGGSLESNGGAGVTSTKGGVYLTGGPSQAGVAVSVFGVYIENNVGVADFLVDNSAAPGVYSFYGDSFQRISSTNYVTNNIKLKGTADLVLSVGGCSFKRLGTYTADVSRKYIDISEAPSARLYFDKSNYQMDAAESVDAAANMRANAELGTLATQDADNVAITGGTIDDASLTSIRSLVMKDADAARAAAQSLGFEYVLKADFSGYTTQSTSEDVLQTITIPAGAMGPNGYIKLETWWEAVGTNDTRTIRARFGGPSGTQYLAITLTNTQLSHKDTRIIANAGSENAQVGGISSQGNGGGWGSSTATGTSSSVDTSEDVDLVLTGVVGNANDLVRLRGYIVKVCYRP